LTFVVTFFPGSIAGFPATREDSGNEWDCTYNSDDVDGGMVQLVIGGEMPGLAGSGEESSTTEFDLAGNAATEVATSGSYPTCRITVTLHDGPPSNHLLLTLMRTVEGTRRAPRRGRSPRSRSTGCPTPSVPRRRGWAPGRGGSRAPWSPWSG
jgi:hypothetical protein